LLSNIIKKGQEKSLARGETLKKVDENYFNRHFAATPKAESHFDDLEE
jgi:hypothetical protein